MTRRGAAAALIIVGALLLGTGAPAPAAEPAADLSVNLVGPGEAVAGRSADYEVHVGLTEPPTDLSSVRAVLTLPDGATFASVQPGAAGPCTAAGQTVTCTTTAQGTPESLRWQVTVRFAESVALGSRLQFSVVASSAGAEATPADNTSTSDTTVVHVADLGVTAIPPAGPITLGEDVEYALVIRNHGPGAVRHFALREVFDDRWYGGGTVTGYGDGECFADPGRMACDVVVDLQPGQEVRLDHVLPTEAGDTVRDREQSIFVELFPYAGDDNRANDSVRVPLEFAGAGSPSPSPSPSASPSASPSPSPSPSATTAPDEVPSLPITG